MTRVVFAFSGSIDDVLAIYWLKQHRGFDVVALLADVGQGFYLEPLAELAIESGAERTVVADVRRRLVTGFIFPTLQSGAQYENYLLSTPLARYAICEELVRQAEEHDVEYVGHGSSSHGNDQVRFVTSIAALAPDLQVINPLLDRRYVSLTEKREDLRRLRLPDRPEFHRDISVDRNLWGCGSVHGELGDPWYSPNPDLFQVTTDPRSAPEDPCDLVIEFERGIPVGLDGKRCGPVKLVEEVGRLGGEHGVGRLDHMENRMLGGKSREIYEAPAATLLYLALGALEELAQPRELNRYKRILAEEYGRLVYEGGWFSELREALDAFLDVSQRYVTGRVRLRLFKGHATVTGRESEYSIYDRNLVDSAEGREQLRAISRGVVDQLALASRTVKRSRPRAE